jgi:site-specific DNA-cytosine methylase
MTMKYISVFSGIEAATAAWSPLGWKPLAFSEIEPFPKAVLAAHHPDVPDLGDITKVDWSPYAGKADVLVGGSPCFPAGTLVLAADRLTPIEDIRVGDMVLTHRNRWRRVTAVGSKTSATITVASDGVTVECTPNHPFYAESDEGADSPREWVRADAMAGRRWLTVNALADPLPTPAMVSADGEAGRTFEVVGRALASGGDADVYHRGWAWLFIRADGPTVPAWVFAARVEWRAALSRGYHAVASGSPTPAVVAAMRIIDAGLHGNDADGDWGSVRSLSRSRDHVKVYNLEVEDDHSYTADAIAVHNCQSFSIAGTRAGLNGASGLMWEYVRAVRELRPRWFLWENVPGALSSAHGEDFRCLLTSMDELGYGLSWRVLDAQFFGVAQRRRRVFLVGHLGDERSGEVLFEPESLRWDTPSSREKREGLTRGTQNGVGEASEPRLNHHTWEIAGNIIGRQEKNGGHQLGIVDPDKTGAFTLTTADRHAIADCLTPWDNQGRRLYRPDGVYPALDARTGNAGGDARAVMTNYGSDIAGTLTRRYDSSPCADRGQNIVLAAGFSAGQSQFAGSIGYEHEMTPTLRASGSGTNQVPTVLVKTDDPKRDQPTIAFAANQRDEVRDLHDLAGTLAAQPGIKGQTYVIPENAADPVRDREVEMRNLHDPAAAIAAESEESTIMCRAGGQVNSETDRDLSPTLTTHDAKDPHIIYPERTGACSVLRMRAGCAGVGKDALIQNDASGTLALNNDQTLFPPHGGIRRLTPMECERLQGFPTRVKLDVSAMTEADIAANLLAGGVIAIDLDDDAVHAHTADGDQVVTTPFVDAIMDGAHHRIRTDRLAYQFAFGAIPDGMVIVHDDHDESNNHPDNLSLAPVDDAPATDDGSAVDAPTVTMPVSFTHDYMSSWSTYRDLAAWYGIDGERIDSIVSERGWTDIPWHGKDHAADAPRYRALGNSMCVQVMRWLGERIARADAMD